MCECAQEDKVPQGGQACSQHRFEWKCQLALECGQDDRNTPLGVQHLATDLQTRNNLEDDGMEYLHWRRSSSKSTFISSGMEDYDLVEKQKEVHGGCANVSRWKQKWRFHTRGFMWDTPVATGTGGHDWKQKLTRCPSRKEDRDCAPHEDDEAADDTVREETWRYPQQRAERSRPHGARGH